MDPARRQEQILRRGRRRVVGPAQEVTRRGKPAVVVLSAADYARMLHDAEEHRGSFVQHLLEFPADPLAPRAEVRPRDVTF